MRGKLFVDAGLRFEHRSPGCCITQAPSSPLGKFRRGHCTLASSPDSLDFLPAMTSEEPLHMKTPVRDSMTLSKVAGTNVYLKMDSSQPSGSFKIRGIGHFCKTVQDGVGILGGGAGTPSGPGLCELRGVQIW